MKQIRTGITLILITLVSACGQVKTKTETVNYPSDWKSIDESSYSIHFPDSFIVDTSGKMGMTFDLLTKRISPQDMFSENINLIIEDMKDKNVTLDRYVEFSTGQLKSFATKSKILSSERVKNNDSEYHTIIFTADQGMYKLKFEQNYRVKNGLAYVLTFSSEANQYDTYKNICEKIMNSFVLKE